MNKTVIGPSLKKLNDLSKRLFGLLCLGFVALGCFGLMMSFSHAYHTSITKIDHNAKQKSLEISVRVFTDDLESVLSRDNNKQQFRIDNNDKNDAAVERYIRKVFKLTNAKGQAKMVDYIGKENEGEATWIYLEIAHNEALTNHKLYQNVLMDMFEDQVNIVNITFGGNRHSYVFNEKQSVHTLE
jgi:hypothetical protein